MIRRLPPLATLVVLLSVATMIGLGIWQLGRAKEKEALLARYGAARDLPEVVITKLPAGDDQLPLFRRARAVCQQPLDQRAMAGRNLKGEVGYVHVVQCSAGPDAVGLNVELGWSQDPRARVVWRGGPVTGVIAPDSRSRIRLVSSSAARGLQPSAPPSIETIPNSHRFYAVQWFLFAGIALLIYLLAVRKKLRDMDNSREAAR